jgi:hypothetical protein
MAETTQQTSDTSNGDDQRIEGETATVTVNPFGPRVARDYQIDLDGGMKLGTVKQEAREAACADGLDVFSVTKVNGRFLKLSGGGFYETQPEDQGPGGGTA